MIILSILAFILQFIIERFYNSGYRLYDPSPILTFEAIGLYFIVLEFVKIKNNVLKRSISFIAKYTYIFYLFHNMIIKLVFQNAKFSLNISAKKNLLYGMLAYIITYIITMVCSIIFKSILDTLTNIKNKKNKEIKQCKD